MFDIGWTELFVVGVIALVFLGPKELPRALYQLGRLTRAARKVTGDFQRQIDQMVREAELEDVKKTVTSVRNTVDVRKKVRDALDPVGDIRKAFEPPKFSGSPGSPTRPASAGTLRPATTSPAQPAAASAADAAGTSPATQAAAPANSAETMPPTPAAGPERPSSAAAADETAADTTAKAG